MTHPDIDKMEHFGVLCPNEEYADIELCLQCGTELSDNMPELVKSDDGIFCEMECCHEYYGIRYC